MENLIIKQVIIVEGKTDTNKLQKIFGKNIKTIETNGLSLNKKTLDFIRQVNQKNGVIIFTDPDGPGKKIREKIIDYLDGQVFNAFILKSDINKNSKKIGIAEANDQSIKDSLKHLIIFDSSQKQTLSWEEYLKNDFYLKENRQKIASFFGWSNQISSKTMFKWLNLINYDLKQVYEILRENNNES